jgi:hypothetical protein
MVGKPIRTLIVEPIESPVPRLGGGRAPAEVRHGWPECALDLHHRGGEE